MRRPRVRTPSPDRVSFSTLGEKERGRGCFLFSFIYFLFFFFFFCRFFFFVFSFLCFLCSFAARRLSPHHPSPKTKRPESHDPGHFTKFKIDGLFRCNSIQLLIVLSLQKPFDFFCKLVFSHCTGLAIDDMTILECYQCRD